MPLQTDGVWNWEYIKEKMKEGVVVVTFKKANNEIREMECTLADYLLPETSGAGSTHSGYLTVICFDLEKEDWRSFRKDRVIDVEIL